MSGSTSTSALKPLNIDAGKQPNDNWCWAYVARAISKFHDPATSQWTPCKLANAAFKPVPAMDCCTHVHHATCDRTYHLKDAFKEFTKNLRAELQRPITAAEIRAEIANKSPICVRVLWPGEGDRGHVFIIRGIGKNSMGRDVVVVTDPVYGDGTWELRDLLKNYTSSRGQWHETYLTCPSNGTASDGGP